MNTKVSAYNYILYIEIVGVHNIVKLHDVMIEEEMQLFKQDIYLILFNKKRAM